VIDVVPTAADVASPWDPAALLMVAVGSLQTERRKRRGRIHEKRSPREGAKASAARCPFEHRDGARSYTPRRGSRVIQKDHKYADGDTRQNCTAQGRIPPIPVTAWV
jgi:hypothetical protein